MILEVFNEKVEALHSTIAPNDDKEAQIIVGDSAADSTNLKECDGGERMSILDFSDEHNNDADISDADTIPSSIINQSEAAGKISACAAVLFTCNDCGKTFNRIGNLRRHERMLHFKSNFTSKTIKDRAQRKSKLKVISDG